MAITHITYIKAFQMNKASIIVSVAFLFLSTACEKVSNRNMETNQTVYAVADNAAMDSLAITINRLDSIHPNCGQLKHFDIWTIGVLNGIEVQAQKFSTENYSINFITLRKDCGGENFCSWEDGYIFQSEIPSLFKAINRIKRHLKRKTNHDERYTYTTKDHVSVTAETTENGWGLRLSVDATKRYTYVNLTSAELDKLVVLLKRANQKLIKENPSQRLIKNLK